MTNEGTRGRSYSPRSSGPSNHARWDHDALLLLRASALFPARVHLSHHHGRQTLLREHGIGVTVGGGRCNMCEDVPEYETVLSRMGWKGPTPTYSVVRVRTRGRVQAGE